jgi:hypothetical protein
MRVSFQVRRSTYRHREGFLIIGCGQGYYNTKIFTNTRASAEHIRAQLRLDERYMVTLADFAILD